MTDDGSYRCANGGVCHVLSSGWQCTCSGAWSGLTCETPVAATLTTGNNQNLAIVIGLLVGLAAIIVLITIIAVILCYYRDKEQERVIVEDSDTVSETVTVTTSKAWYPEYRTDITKLNESTYY